MKMTFFDNLIVATATALSLASYSAAAKIKFRSKSISLNEGKPVRVKLQIVFKTRDCNKFQLFGWFRHIDQPAGTSFGKDSDYIADFSVLSELLPCSAASPLRQVHLESIELTILPTPHQVQSTIYFPANMKVLTSRKIKTD